MTAESSGLVRKIPGPFVTRVCVATAKGFVWGEQVSRPQGSYLGVKELRMLSERLAAHGVAAFVPRLRGDGLAVWSPAPVPGLLCDTLFSPHGPYDDRWWRDTCTALGRYLARIHSVDVRHVTLPRRDRLPAWLVNDPEALVGVAGARRRLPLDAAPGLARAADSARHRAPTPEEETLRLVHGRFSTGMLLPGPTPVAFGWREAGLGDPLRDIAYLLGEFVEAAGMHEASWLVERVQAFLTGYGEELGVEPTHGCRARLAGLIADRVVDHYAHGMWAFGAGDKLPETLAAIEAQWRVLSVALRAGPERQTAVCGAGQGRA